MSLFQRFLRAVQTWRRSRGGTRPPKRADFALERLDHRQLLSVNFSGNVLTDFSVTQKPGVVFLDGTNNPAVVHPQIPPSLQPIIKVSGFDINGILMAYDPATDSLSIGLKQPDNQKTGQPVIAGDSDNNLNSATVDPAVSALEPGFQDPADMGGTKTMGAFLNLGAGGPTIVAGFPSAGQNQNKHYEVANAIVNPNFPNSIPKFGTELPQNEGNYYLVNDPAHPNFEFSIAHFSQLYLAETGHALTPTSVISVGAFGTSDQDAGISDAFFPPQPVKFGDLVPTTDVSIVKTEMPNPAVVGQPFTYVMTVANSGPAPSNNVMLTDPLPAGLNYVGSTASQGTATFANGILTANLGTLQPGASAQVTLVVTGTVPGNVTNTATVSGTPDSNPNNDTASVVTTINAAQVCPPFMPPILINPHLNSHVNTAHNDLVRVNVFGQAGFDVNQIVPSSVRLGGAAPLADYTRYINRDPYLDKTFVFRGSDIHLPGGIVDAHVTGMLQDGLSFDSVRRIFVKNDAFFPPSKLAARDQRLQLKGLTPPDVPGLGIPPGAATVVHPYPLVPKSPTPTYLAAPAAPTNQIIPPIDLTGRRVSPAVLTGASAYNASLNPPTAPLPIRSGSTPRVHIPGKTQTHARASTAPVVKIATRNTVRIPSRNQAPTSSVPVVVPSTTRTSAAYHAASHKTSRSQTTTIPFVPVPFGPSTLAF